MRRIAAVVGVVALVAVPGCQLFYRVDAELDAKGAIDAAGPTDGADAGAPPASCTSFALDEGFDMLGADPRCPPKWATNFNASGTLSYGSGVLSILPTNATDGIGCTSQAPQVQLTAGGIFVELVHAIDRDGTFSALEYGAYSIGTSDGFLVFALHGNPTPPLKQLQYDAAEMRWLRIRPSIDGVAGDYGSDGMTWTNLTDLPLGSAATGNFDLGVYPSGGYDPSMAAEFTNLRLCD